MRADSINRATSIFVKSSIQKCLRANVCHACLTTVFSENETSPSIRNPKMKIEIANRRIRTIPSFFPRSRKNTHRYNTHVSMDIYIFLSWFKNLLKRRSVYEYLRTGISMIFLMRPQGHRCFVKLKCE